jgi:hypothetical protein
MVLLIVSLSVSRYLGVSVFCYACFTTYIQTSALQGWGDRIPVLGTGIVCRLMSIRSLYIPSRTIIQQARCSRHIYPLPPSIRDSTYYAIRGNTVDIVRSPVYKLIDESMYIRVSEHSYPQSSTSSDKPRRKSTNLVRLHTRRRLPTARLFRGVRFVKQQKASTGFWVIITLASARDIL